MIAQHLKASLLLSMSLVAACATHSIRPESSAAPPQLRKSSAAYVVVPEDGRYYEDKPYVGSGRMTAVAFSDALRNYVESVSLGPRPKDGFQSLQVVGTSVATYVFLPEILHWEDRSTEWSGRPDRIEIQVTVIEASTGKPLNQTIITGRSSWFTLGGDHPQEMLAGSVGEYIATLFGD
ncbi:MAG: DUF4823 domain-containing protein [Gammaproteobacteria bacterium]|nr:DUF4823 domain-containing protein [Gammaproteobacteria bacterium]